MRVLLLESNNLEVKLAFKIARKLLFLKDVPVRWFVACWSVFIPEWNYPCLCEREGCLDSDLVVEL